MNLEERMTIIYILGNAWRGECNVKLHVEAGLEGGKCSPEVP